jgi:hypothetical protein
VFVCLQLANVKPATNANAKTNFFMFFVFIVNNLDYNI